MQRDDCRGGFQKKKKFSEAKEIASLDMGARNQYSSINFLGEFIESTCISKFFIANVRDFYTVVLVAGKATRVPRLLIISPRSLNNFCPVSYLGYIGLGYRVFHQKKTERSNWQKKSIPKL